MSGVETVRFRLKDGVAESEFLRHNRKVEEEYLVRRPGFQSRQTARGEDGEWLIIVHWASTEDAEATMSEFSAAPEAEELLAAIDYESLSASSYSVVA
jgi:heme-degrading monooxygenase HmoA